MRWSRFIPKSKLVEYLWYLGTGMYLGTLINTKVLNWVYSIVCVLYVFNVFYLKPRENKEKRKRESAVLVDQFKFRTQDLIASGFSPDLLKDFIDEALVQTTLES